MASDIISNVEIKNSSIIQQSSNQKYFSNSSESNVTQIEINAVDKEINEYQIRSLTNELIDEINIGAFENINKEFNIHDVVPSNSYSVTVIPSTLSYLGEDKISRKTNSAYSTENKRISLTNESKPFIIYDCCPKIDQTSSANHLNKIEFIQKASEENFRSSINSETIKSLKTIFSVPPTDVDKIFFNEILAICNVDKSFEHNDTNFDLKKVSNTFLGEISINIESRDDKFEAFITSEFCMESKHAKNIIYSISDFEFNFIEEKRVESCDLNGIKMVTDVNLYKQ